MGSVSNLDQSQCYNLGPLNAFSIIEGLAFYERVFILKGMPHGENEHIVHMKEIKLKYYKKEIQ